MTVRRFGSRALMGVCLLLLLPAVAVGQQRRGPDMDTVITELTEKLELTEEQAGEIRELLEVQRQESRKLIEEARASGEGRAGMAGMRERMREIRDATSTAVKEILTAEQVVVYEALQAEQRGRRPRGAGGP